MYFSLKSTMRLVALFLPLTLAMLAGCAQEEQAAEEAQVADAKEPRVFFIEPQDGATVKSPVLFKFGAENFTIEPITDPMTVKEGSGHFHIAVDGTCLDPGVIIPTADPWIHFGDGSSEVEVILTPGEHTICLQVGDGEHRTVEGDGLKTEITITVEE